MTAAAIVTYAYDQIDQARAALVDLSKQTNSGLARIRIEVAAVIHSCDRAN